MIKSYLYFLIGILLLVTIFLDCSKKEDTKESLVAMVGTDEIHGKITEKDFLYSYELTPSPFGNLKGLEAKKAHLNMMIDKKLLVLEGLQLNLDKDENVLVPLKWYEEKAVRQQLYREVVRDKVAITEAELREAFLKLNVTLRVRHLVAKTKEEANKLRNNLLNGATFEDLARVIFKDSVLANNGGDLGYFTWGEMDENFERAAFALNVGEISEPVKTKWGYHIIKLEEKIKNAILTESEFQRKKRMIQKILRKRKEAKFANKYIKDFMNPKKVKVYGPSIVFLVEQSKEILREDKTLLPLDAPKLLDVEIGKIRQQVEDHLDEVLVEFKGGKWTIGEFLEKLKRIHPKARPTMTSKINLKDVVARMVRDEFLAQEGYRRGLQHSNYVKEEVRRWKEELIFLKLRKDLLDTVNVTLKEMKEYFKQNKSRYKEPSRVNIREIFVRDKKEADEILERIKGGEDFAKLAVTHSVRKWAAKRGGEFGFFGYGMYGEIGKKALSMNVGELGGPIEIENSSLGHGFSIFEVIAKKEERYKTFEEAREQVELDLLEIKKKKLLTRFLAHLKGKFDVQVDEELLANIHTTDDIAKGRKVQMFAIPRY